MTYDLIGGVGAVPPVQNYTAGAQVTVSTVIPMRDNLVFDGWTDGSITYQSGQSFSMPTQNIVLYAKWTVAAPTWTSNEDFENNFYVEQAFSNSCTLASVTMMLRRKAMLNGDAEWQAITEESIFSSVWNNGTWRNPYTTPKEKLRGSGVKWDFQYKGMVVHSLGKEVRSQRDKTAYFISELEVHPEGIVIYDQSNRQHAVLLINYDPISKEFKCADPANGYGIVSLKDSYIAKNHGGTQEAVISTIDQTWYISSTK